MVEVEDVVMAKSPPKRVRKSVEVTKAKEAIATPKATPNSKKERSPEKSQSQSEIIIPKVVPKKPLSAYFIFNIE